MPLDRQAGTENGSTEAMPVAGHAQQPLYRPIPGGGLEMQQPADGRYVLGRLMDRLGSDGTMVIPASTDSFRVVQ